MINIKTKERLNTLLEGYALLFDGKEWEELVDSVVVPEL